MTVGVLLCTCNGERYVRQQLNSIFNQTVLVDELVICDDCSTDQTMAIINDFSNKYPDKIKIYENIKRKGSTLNFSEGVSLCTSDIICLSDQDDLWVVNKVEKIIDFFIQHETVSCVFSDAKLIDENDVVFDNTTLWESFGFKNELLNARDNDALFRLNCSWGNIMTGATTAFRRDSSNLWISSISVNRIHDQTMSMVYISKSSLGIIEDPLIYYRISSTQQAGIRVWKYANLFYRSEINVFKREVYAYYCYIIEKLRMYHFFDPKSQFWIKKMEKYEREKFEYVKKTISKKNVMYIINVILLMTITNIKYCFIRWKIMKLK